MKKYCHTKNSLQIDLKLENDNFKSIELDLANQVKESINFLAAIASQQNGFPHIREYHNEFLDKYGVDREVSIQELLDENIGLGALAGYKYPQSYRKIQKNVKKNEKILNIFLDKIMEC
ncbi:hypothetical protein GCL57_11420 [Fluviispira multicolorata]|uniref:Lantibiotic dehydratase N-terminal domain-containing protein n=1 Tax=Fluviispira multicolorata TaxID=2654512 RepID=A0A833JDT5_9BACT|nr:hypothetical protein GCL57_11420 [Fluviispira multicolorata]